MILLVNASLQRQQHCVDAAAMSSHVLSPDSIGLGMSACVESTMDYIDPTLRDQWTHARHIFDRSVARPHQSDPPTTDDRVTLLQLPLPESLQYVSLLREPEAVAQSAALYTPGRLLLKPNQSRTPELVDNFVLGFTNKSAAWTQFRYFWFGPDGPFMGFSTNVLYERLSKRVRVVAPCFVGKHC